MQRKVHKLHQMPEGQITWVLKTVAGLDWEQRAPRTSLSERTVSMRARLGVAHPVGETFQPILPLPCGRKSRLGKVRSLKKLTADQIWSWAPMCLAPLFLHSLYYVCLVSIQISPALPFMSCMAFNLGAWVLLSCFMLWSPWTPALCFLCLSSRPSQPPKLFPFTSWISQSIICKTLFLLGMLALLLV